MADQPTTINIQIDEDALREQINKTIQDALRDASMSLRKAADQIDNNEWINGLFANHEERLKAEYKKGFEAGRAAAEQDGEKGDA